MRAVWLLLALHAPLVFADQVVLKNGDTITGSIVQKDGDKLTLKSEFLGEVSMPWSSVRSIRSDEPLTVVLPNGETVNGKVSIQGETVEVAGKSAPVGEVAAMRNSDKQQAWERLQHPRLLQLWRGFFDMGLALTRGNARADTFTTGFNASRVTGNDKFVVHFSQIRATARIDGIAATTASAVRAGWNYDRPLSSRLFFTTLNDYEHDRFQNLNLRFTLGAGLGANVVKRENLTFSVSGGGDYSRENFLDNLHRNSAEFNAGDDLLYKLSSVTTIVQSFRMFPNLSRTGDYRLNLDVSGVTAVRKWLSWNVSASDHLLSNPIDARQRNDLILSTGFRFSFAQ